MRAIEVEDEEVKNTRIYTEAEYIHDTLKHINLVQQYMFDFMKQLDQRAKAHDESKLKEPEKSILLKYSPLLDTCEYGTDEYYNHLDKVKGALNHHYKQNSHHPEHYANGIYGMDLLDIVEMYFDWQASAIKYENTIENSIDIGKERFSLSDELVAIFKNTAERQRKL